MSTILDDSSFYTTQFALYYGQSGENLDSLSSFQEKLWDKFVLVYKEKTGQDINHDSLSTSEIKEGFTKFVQQYSLLHISSDVLESSTELPQSGFYSDYLTSFFGAFTETEKKDIWNAFLSTQDDPFVESPTTQADFATYVRGTLSRLTTTSPTLSPEEIKSRYILNDVIGNLRGMLGTIEDLVRVQAELLMTYGEWQEEYTEMMTRVPNLLPVDNYLTSTSTTVQLPNGTDIENWDLRGFTFGYNKTSLVEVIEWGIDRALNNPDEWIEFGGDEMGSYNFRGITDNEGTVTQIELQCTYPEETTPQIATIELFDAQGNHRTKEDALGNPVYMGLNDWIEEAQTDFKGFFTNFGTEFLDYYNDLFMRDVGPEGIPIEYESYREGLSGRFLSTSLKSEDFKLRGEQNAILQQYVENIRNLRTLVADKTQQLQLSLADAKEGVNKIAGLWTVILEMIDNVMKSIFKDKR